MSNISEQLGEHIRTLRHKRGLSQEELAFRATLNPGYLGQIERAKKKPTIETLEKIVTALEISFEELFIFTHNSTEHKESSIIDKINYELKYRSVEEQEIIYKIIKQILVFKDHK